MFNPSLRRLTWQNGAVATLYSADEPERLRGPQHDYAAVDELCAFRRLEAWDQLLFGLRLGDNSRVAIATTPKPTKILKSLLAREGQDVVVSRSTSYENRANLAPQFFDQITRKYENTRLVGKSCWPRYWTTRPVHYGPGTALKSSAGTRCLSCSGLS